MKHPTSYSLPVTLFREGEYVVAYSPVLDLSSTGRTEEEAKTMFAEAVEVLFEELEEMGTLEGVLKDLGWTRAKGLLQPPELIQHAMMRVQVSAA